MILRIVRAHARRHPLLACSTVVLTLFVTGLWVAEPLYSSYAVDQLLTLKTGAVVNFWWIFGVWAAIFVCTSLGQALEHYFMWDFGNTLVIERRNEVYRHVLNLDIAFHAEQRSGEIMKIVDEAADMIWDLQRVIFQDLVPSFLAGALFLIIGFTIAPLLSLILIVTLVIYSVVVLRGVKKTWPLQHAANKLWVSGMGRAFDAVLNIVSVKSASQEEEEDRKLQKANAAARRKQLQVNRHWAVIESVNFFLLARILLMSVGVLLFVHDTLTLGELYFFQASFFRVLVPFEILSGLLPQWNRQVGKVRLAEELLQTPPTVLLSMESKIPSSLRGEITLQSVSFAYSPHTKKFHTDDEDETNIVPVVPHEGELPLEHGEKHSQKHDEEDDGTLRLPREVIRDITLTIQPGEHIAFVGHSGAGKSTMAMLLNRFYDVTGGKILVDGTDLRELDPKWWRSQIGLVLQDNIMFNDSILNNIRYARPDATMEEVREAARRAAAAEFIEKLTHGYETLIGDRGIKLSGGQRQRLAIARAMLKQPKIVILDEATSALDSVTEREVQNGIRELIAGRTSVIIAHRLSTVRSVDRIAVLEKGKLIACAPHEELLKTCDIYREMVELQSQGMLAE